MTLSERLDKSVQALISFYQVETENLTEEQLASAFKQALLAGDFQRFVIKDGGQRVVYIPFAREQQLVNQVHELEARIKELECTKQ